MDWLINHTEFQRTTDPLQFKLLKRFERGDLRIAEAAAARAVSQSSDLNLAQGLLAREAMQIFQSSQKPQGSGEPQFDDAPTWRRRIDVARQRKDTIKDVGNLKELIALQIVPTELLPLQTEAYLVCGTLLHLRNDYSSAETMFREARLRYTADGDAGRASEAEEALKKVLWDGTIAKTRDRRPHANFKSKLWDEPVEIWDATIQIFGESSHPLVSGSLIGLRTPLTWDEALKRAKQTST
jgi:hypothetical protein